MGLEVFGPDSRPTVLNVAWPLLDDPLNKGDDHLRLIKTTLLNFYNDVWESGTDVIKVGNIPPAVDSATTGAGFGGFRYQVVDDAGKKTLRLFTT